MLKKSKKIFAVLLSVFMAVQCVAFVPASAEVSEDNPNLIINGDFENIEKTGWDKDSFNILPANDEITPYEGDYYAKLWGGGTWFYQEVDVEKNTLYNLSFAYLNQEKEYIDQLRVIVLGDGGVVENVIKSGESLIGTANTEKPSKSGKLYDVSKTWTRASESFNSGDNEKIYIIIENDGTTGLDYSGEYKGKISSACIDGIELTKKMSLENGSFENGVTAWDRQGTDGQFSVETATDTFPAYDGNTYARLWSGRGTWFCQAVTVEKNTRYSFSFAHRNNSDTNGTLRILIAGNNGISNGFSNDGTSLIGDQDTETTTHYNAGKLYTVKNEWTEETESFNSGNNTTVYIVVKNYNDSAIANVDTSPRVDGFELKEVQNTEILNGGFENGANSWESALTIYSGTDEVPAYEGVSYARLWGTGWSTYQKVTVEKNTNYSLKFAYKNTIIDGVSNKLRVYVAGKDGIDSKCIPINGNSLIGLVNDVYPRESGIIYDIKEGWTEIEETFNTGANNKIWVVFRHDGDISGSNYKGMSIDGVSLTKIPEITVNNISAVKNDNTINFSAKIYNGKIDETINTFVIAAIYDENDKLVNISVKNAEVAYKAEAQDYTDTITLNEGADTTGYTAAIYLWNRTTNMPYTAKTPVVITSSN